jgi:hypothetical protein
MFPVLLILTFYLPSMCSSCLAGATTRGMVGTGSAWFVLAWSVGQGPRLTARPAVTSLKRTAMRTRGARRQLLVAGSCSRP